MFKIKSLNKLAMMGWMALMSSQSMAASTDYHYESDSLPDTLMAGPAKVRMLCDQSYCDPVNIEFTHAHQVWVLEDWKCPTSPCNLETSIAWHPHSRMISIQTPSNGYHLIQVVRSGLVDMGEGYTAINDGLKQVTQPPAQSMLPWSQILSVKMDGRLLVDQKATCNSLKHEFYNSKNEIEATLAVSSPDDESLSYKTGNPESLMDFALPNKKNCTKSINCSGKSRIKRKPEGKKKASASLIATIDRLSSLSMYCDFPVDDSFVSLLNNRTSITWEGSSAKSIKDVGYWNSRTGSREVP